MHIYVLTRGILSATKQWENDLAAQYLPFEVIEKGKKKPSKYLAQLQVRPVNLYEIVCPEDCEAQVMGLLKPTTEKGFGGKWGKTITLITKLLGLKSPLKNWTPSITPPGDGVSVLCLGTKKDKLNWEKKKDASQLLVDGHIPQELL